MATSIRVCVIPGDDAAPEAMQASVRVLGSLDLPIEWDHVLPGRELSELDAAERDALVHAQIDAADTVLFRRDKRNNNLALDTCVGAN